MGLICLSAVWNCNVAYSGSSHILVPVIEAGRRTIPTPWSKAGLLLWAMLWAACWHINSQHSSIYQLVSVRFRCVGVLNTPLNCYVTKNPSTYKKIYVRSTPYYPKIHRYRYICPAVKPADKSHLMFTQQKGNANEACKRYFSFFVAAVAVFLGPDCWDFGFVTQNRSAPRYKERMCKHHEKRCYNNRVGKLGTGAKSQETKAKGR